MLKGRPMSIRLKSLFFCLFSSLILMGCSSSDPHKTAIQQRDAENLKAWDHANSKFIACNRAWQAERRQTSSQFNDLVIGAEDPRYLQSLTSKTPVNQAFKDALVKFRPQQIACRKELFNNLGDKNIRVLLLYRDAFQILDAGMADVLTGRLKTMGEVNRAYSKWVDDANDASILLRASMQGLVNQ